MWFDGDDDRALARDLVDRALDPDAASGRRGRPGQPPPVRRIQRRDGPRRAASGRRRRLARGRSRRVGVARSPARASASRIAPTTAVDGLLERVAVGRDDPRRRPRSGAARPARVASRSIAPPQRLEDRRGLRAVRVQAALLGAAPGPLVDRRVEVDLEVGVGQHDRADVAAGHHDPAVRARGRAGAASSAARTSGTAETAETAASTAGAADVGGVVDAVDEHAGEAPVPRPSRAGRRRRGRRGPPGRRPTRRGPRPARSRRGTAGRCRRSGSRPRARPPRRRCSCPTSRGRRGPRPGVPSAAGYRSLARRPGEDRLEQGHELVRRVDRDPLAVLAVRDLDDRARRATSTADR